MEYTQEQLKTAYKNLPPDLQDAIFNVESAQVIQIIGKNNNLTAEQIGSLAEEIALIMLGLNHPTEFIPNLSHHLNIDKEAAKKIAQEVNDQLFSKVRHSLKKIYHLEETSQIKTEIIKEIEKEEPKITDILQNLKAPTEEGVSRAPMQESEHSNSDARYPQGDPYREPI
ncbi:MAG: hypothetical protein AB1643_01015 [Patescibacteria group bacterium]